MTRNKRLDVLRCIAVLLVLFRHSGINWRLARAGWVGVDLFFVLSGFLISGILFSEYKQRGSINFKRFFIRRGFKIYPAFYVFLMVTFLVEHSSFAHTLHSGRQFFSEILYIQNYGLGAVWPHTWSLAVEEHFYILLPIFFILLVRFAPNRLEPFRWLPVSFLVVGVLCLIFRTLTILQLPSATEDWLVLRKVFIPTHNRIDALFFGVLLGYLHHFRPALLEQLFSLKRNIMGLIAVAALLLVPALVLPEENRLMLAIGLTMLYLGFGIVLLLVLHMPKVVPDRLARLIAPVSGGFAFLGLYSYSIYLWHGATLPWGLAILRRVLHLEAEGFTLNLLYFAVSLMVGVGASKLIEYPVLTMRDRLFPSMVSPGAERASNIQSVESKVLTTGA